MPHLTSV